MNGFACSPRLRIQLVILAAAFAAAGCERASAGDTAHRTSPDTERAAAATVAGDSILPMFTMIARFREPHARVRSFEGAPASRQELIDRFVRAIEDSSATALRALTLTQAEFAWLYFPTSLFARPPYAQPPAVTWLLTGQNGRKGEDRLLRDYGGRPLEVIAHECEPEPRLEGENRIWHHCPLTVRGAAGEVERVRLFGSIIERHGRFRFISLANRL